MSEAGFWDDQDKAAEVLALQKRAKAVVDPCDGPGVISTRSSS
jgi:hypothetical protein